MILCLRLCQSCGNIESGNIRPTQNPGGFKLRRMCPVHMIKVDISNVWGEIALPDLLAMEKEVASAHATLTDGTGAGNDFLGWLNRPTREATEEILRIQSA